ncbi:MAG: methionyl-tRNA formyltransferase, partial [Candidatus Margulisiibacteriota bacterium]
LPVYTPHSKTELSETLFDINPDLVLVIAYGMLIEKRIVDHFFCVNAHASILPKYRGASPIQSSLLNGDLLTGITLIKLNERMDAGDVLLTSKLKITTQDTFGSLSEKLSKLTADVCTSFIRGSFIANQYTLTPQDESLATYCTKIQKDDLFLSDDLSPLMIHNKIKAYSPLPGAYCILNGKRIKVLDASFENDHLQFLIVQPEGKAAMSYSDYLLGNPGGIGIYGN